MTTNPHRGDPTVNHPSTTCYTSHGCRCDGCRRCNTESTKRWRNGLPPKSGEIRRRRCGHGEPGTPLDEETLLRLRRAVGLIKD